MSNPINTLPAHQSRRAPATHQVHLKDYLEILKRRKWVVIAFFGSVVGLVALLSFIAKPTYRATTQILIDKRASSLINIQTNSAAKPEDREYDQTQYNLLRSRSLAAKVIGELELWKGFIPDEPEEGSWPTPSSILEWLTSKIAKDETAPKPKLDSSDPLFQSAVIDWYLNNLQIEPLEGSKLVNISFLDRWAEVAAQVANAHAKAFIAQDKEKQHAASENALRWLTSQLEQQKDKVEASQEALHDYKQVNNIVSMEERNNIVLQKLAELNSALTKAKGQEIIKQATYLQLDQFSVNRDDLMAFPEIIENPVIQKLRTELMQLKAEQTGLSSTLGPQYPQMAQISSRIRQLQKEIAAEMQLWKSTIKAELDRAIAEVNAIQNELEAQKQLALAMNEKAIAHDVLQRDAEMNQSIYDMLLKQAKQISLTSGLEQSNTSIVDVAEVPLFPIKPRILLNIVLAVVLGLFMGVGFAFFLEYMDNTLKTPEEILRRLNLPVLGLIPHYKQLQGRNQPALIHNSPAVKQIADSQSAYPLYDISGSLCSNLRMNTWGMNSRIYLMSSATLGEGKTTVVGHLATQMAEAGLRVLMIDCDMQRSALHKSFGVANDEGLSDSLRRVLTHDISAGSLNECSADDLFFLCMIRRLSGQLTLANHTQSMAITFANGRPIYIQNNNGHEGSRLGTILLRSGFLTESQLEDALDRNQRSGLPLGYILINSGYLTRDKLQGPLRLQMEEQLYKAFSWKQGRFAFTPSRVELKEDERVHFQEDYSATIQHLGEISGSHLVEREILCRIKALETPNLHLLSAGKEMISLSTPLNLPALGKFLAVLRQHFDLILLDSAPLLDAGGTPSLATLSDGVIMVIKAGHLSIKTIHQAKHHLEEVDANILGTILNQVKDLRQKA